MQNLYIDVAKLDQRCYEIYNLPEDILMEHAAFAITQQIQKQFPKGASVLIVAGPGNNGGDGIACARQLLKEYEVLLFVPYGAKSQMCKIQLDRFYACGGELIDEIKEADAIVDALFGSGLSKPLREDSVHLIDRLNRIRGFKIACDIPSGIDKDGKPLPVAFEADLTVTMGARKRSLFMDLAKDYVGEVVVADLGVSQRLYEEDSNWKLLEREDLKPPYRTKQNSNKGNYGHLAVIAGEKEGAAIMAAQAALSYGAGLVSVVTFENIAIPYELMHSSHLPPKTTAIAVGMGLGVEYCDDDLDGFLNNNLPLVIDADLFYSTKILKLLERDKIILTPHPKEFASLLKLCAIAEVTPKEVQENRAEFVEEFCRRYPKAVLILKGANPIIAHNGSFFINPLGSNALAKGGSGDVLTGLVGALLAQGYEPLEAALQGSLAHAIASQKVAKANYALRPKDLIEAVSKL